MDENRERLRIINQSMNDVKYMKDTYQPVNGIIRVLKFWIILYMFSNLVFFSIDQMNITLELYNINNFFLIYNIFRIIVCIVIPIILYVYIGKSNSSLKERKFLKTFIVFPFIFCLDNCLSCLSYFLNADILVSYYQTFSLSGIINTIFLLYIYSYVKEKNILILTTCYILYIIISFIYLSIYVNSIEINSFQSNLFFTLNLLQSYRFFEILTQLILLILLKRKYSYEKYI